MRRSFLRILVIFGISATAAGAYVNVKGLSWVPSKTEIDAWANAESKRAALHAQAGLELAEFQALLAEGVIVVDARPGADFEKGHLVISTEPPVLSMPADMVDEGQVNRLMQAQQHTGYPIVLYCNSRACDYAEKLHGQLQSYGFADVRIYLDGWEGIQKAGLPTTKGMDAWQGFEASGEGIEN